MVRHILKYIMLGSSGYKGVIARLENLLVSAAAMVNAQTVKNFDSSNMGNSSGYVQAESVMVKRDC